MTLTKEGNVRSKENGSYLFSVKTVTTVRNEERIREAQDEEKMMLQW